MDRFVKRVGVFLTGGFGDQLKSAVGFSETIIVKYPEVSDLLQVFKSLAINLT